MPLQRRLPKMGFRSALSRRYAAVRLGDLARLEDTVIDLAVLKRTRLVPRGTSVVKVILNGTCEKVLTIRGLRVTRGARARIEALGGRVED
jgi:large subunit ribosomal protein L15